MLHAARAPCIWAPPDTSNPGLALASLTRHVQRSRSTAKAWDAFRGVSAALQVSSTVVVALGLYRTQKSLGFAANVSSFLRCKGHVVWLSQVTLSAVALAASLSC